MIPKHWIKNDSDRSNFEKVKLNKAIEDFDNSTAIKVYQGKVKRYVSSQGILFKLNLEERRSKMRKLLEIEEAKIEEEWFQRIVPQNIRREQLKESAQRIRYQKELERQAVAEEKYNLREKLSNDSMRLIQINLHKNEIVNDRRELKEIQQRITREERCEELFWAAKSREENNKMQQREEFEAARRNLLSTDIYDQMKLKEAQKQRDKEIEIELRKLHHDQATQLQEDLKLENYNNYLGDRRKKEEYRKSLDRHINMSNLIKKKEKERMDALDLIMQDENYQKIHQNLFDIEQKKAETYKHLTDYKRHAKCIEESLMLENKKKNEMVKATQIEKDRKSRQLEDQKQWKYKELVRDIKAAQKDQLLEAQRQKSAMLLERLQEKEGMQEFIRKEEEKYKIALEERKIKIGSHNAALMGQINYNKHTKSLELDEKKRQADSMKEAEEIYKNRCQEMQDQEYLLFKHPWRQNRI